MTQRLHILDTPWNNNDLWHWWRWQRGLESNDPNNVVSNPMVVPQYRITEKLAFGARLLLFWRRLYQRSWTLGSSTHSVSFSLGRQIWSCGLSENPAFRNPSTREAFIEACSQAVALARNHYHLSPSASTLPDGAVRFHAFNEVCSQYDMSAFQEAYSPGTSAQASPEAVDIDRAARTYDPTAVGYAPVVRINGLLSTDVLTDWAVTVAEENQILAILFNVLLFGVHYATQEDAAGGSGGNSSLIPLATIQSVRDRVCSEGEGGQRALDIPVINLREFHRVVFYCDAGRLDSALEDHLTDEANNTKYTLLLEIMDNCIQRRCVTSGGTPWLSLSTAMLQRRASDLMY